MTALAGGFAFLQKIGKALMLPVSVLPVAGLLLGFGVLRATLGVMAAYFGLTPKPIMGIDSMDTGVFGGILIGGVAGALFNRYFRIKLPPYLGFFAGKRFVPIVTAFSAIGIGVVLSLVWPPDRKSTRLNSSHMSISY